MTRERDTDTQNPVSTASKAGAADLGETNATRSSEPESRRLHEAVDDGLSPGLLEVDFQPVAVDRAHRAVAELLVKYPLSGGERVRRLGPSRDALRPAFEQRRRAAPRWPSAVG